MTMTFAQFDVLNTNGSFTGISNKPTKKGAMFVLKMTKEEWLIFQSNQADGGELIQPKDSPAPQGSTMELQVTLDASALGEGTWGKFIKIQIKIKRVIFMSIKHFV